MPVVVVAYVMPEDVRGGKLALGGLSGAWGTKSTRFEAQESIYIRSANELSAVGLHRPRSAHSSRELHEAANEPCNRLPPSNHVASLCEHHGLPDPTHTWSTPPASASSICSTRPPASARRINTFFVRDFGKSFHRPLHARSSMLNASALFNAKCNASRHTEGPSPSR